MTSIDTDALTLLGRTILLIEDDPIVGIDVVDGLENAGAQVLGPIETVADAMTAMSSDNAFDAVLLDAHLADGSVVGILDVLKARGTPYVMMTGDENFGIRYSPDAPCVPKPIDMRKVLRLLASLCDAADPAGR